MARGSNVQAGGLASASGQAAAVAVLQAVQVALEALTVTQGPAGEEAWLVDAGAVDQGAAGMEAWLVDQADPTYGAVLAPQTGAGGVLTFTFAQPVTTVWIRARHATELLVFADPYGGTPTASNGIPVDVGVSFPITVGVPTSTVRVFAPTDVIVTVWGDNG